MREDATDLIGTCFVDLELVKVPECDVQNRTILRGVDVLTREHFVAVTLEFCLTDEGQKGLEDGLGDQVLGVIEEEGDGRVIGGDIFRAEFGKARGILSKQILEDEAGML